MAEPIPQLKTAQRWIKHHILERVALHPRVHGFRRARSIRTNAAPHLGRRVIVCIDLATSFPSIEGRRVFGIFHTLGFGRAVAEALTDLCTFQNGLPIGAPSSPALANLAARRLDYRLHNLGLKLGFAYTRYADDLTFSSNHRDLNRRIPFLKEIVRDEGFTVNENKVWVMRSAGRQEVTGVIINDRASLGRDEARLLRAVIHNCRSSSLDVQREAWARRLGVPDPATYPMATFRQSLRGKVAFLVMIDRGLGTKLAAELAEVDFGD